MFLVRFQKFQKQNVFHEILSNFVFFVHLNAPMGAIRMTAWLVV